MKRILCLLCIIGLTNIASAQILGFDDEEFKQRLLWTSAPGFAKDLNDNWTLVDTNGDEEIELSEALNISWLNVSQANITSVQGIGYFANLRTFYCQQNDLTTLDMNANVELRNLWCDENNLTSILVDQCPHLRWLLFKDNNVSQMDLTLFPALENLDCSGNALSVLDVTNCPILSSFSCEGNFITELDLSHNPLLSWTSFEIPTLIYLNIKNGVVGNLQNATYFSLYGNNSLQYICCDEAEEAGVLAEIATYNLGDIVVNGYCSFAPGGTFYQATGKLTADIDDNGCSSSDPLIPNVKYQVIGEAFNLTFIADNDGTYNIPLPAGSYTISPKLETPEAFASTPESYSVSFPEAASPNIQDFCVTGLNPIADTQIHLIPIVPARPGFDSTYKLIYMNTGNSVESGNITFKFFEDDRVAFVSSEPAASVNGNILSYVYEGLAPFESREILITLHVNSPVDTPSVQVGDALNFLTSMSIHETDPSPMNNTSGLKQFVVGSYDPNDKTCTAGTSVGPEVAGQYVDYVIRFENTGNYPADFVVVKDMIDETMFDVSSLVPISASHDYFTRITGNKVEFIFDNIQLPFDDATNDGYIAFKIRTLPTLLVGDSFSNSASIYFDYNAPVVTDPAVTNIEVLSVSDVNFGGNFILYPNPAENILRIKSTGLAVTSVEIYNMLGQLVLSAIHSDTLDASELKTGNYLIRLKTENGTATSIFTKK